MAGVAFSPAAVRRYEPLVPVAAAFIVGILLGEYAAGPMLVWCGAAIAAATVWALLYLRGVHERWLLAPLVVLVAAGGAARYRASVDPAPDDVARLAEGGRRMVTVEGTVVRSVRQFSPPDDVFLPGRAEVPLRLGSGPSPPGDGSPPLSAMNVRCTFTVDCSRVFVDGRWVPASGGVTVAVRRAVAPDGPALHLGDRVHVSGVLAPFGPPANPGAFDIAAYLRRQGIRASVQAGYWEAVRVVETASDPVRWLIGRMQRWAVACLDGLPTAEGRAVAAAIVFGRRDLLDFDAGQFRGQDIERAFLATGTTHMLAVSGFNVGLVAGSVLILLRFIGVGLRATAVIVAAAVLAFVLMTELEPPVLRAAILLWVLCVGWFVGREAFGVNSLAAAVLLVLAARPGDLFTTSFQLSFVAVLGMMFLARRIEYLLFGRLEVIQRLRHPRRGTGFWYRGLLRGALMVSLAATAASVPLIAHRFHFLAWTAPLTTTVLCPMVLALTVAGMALVALGWIHAWVYGPLAIATDALGRAVAATVETLAEVPCGYFYVGSASLGWVLAAYVLLGAFAWRERLGLSGRRVAIGLLAAAGIFVWTGGHGAPAHPRVSFFAVGNGNTNLVELPNGRNILYDAGSSVSRVRAGEAALAPALWACGVDRLDAVFLSHPHFDHFKDILPLVDRFGVRQVFVPPTFLRTRLQSDNSLVEALVARGVRVEMFGAGDRLSGTGAVDVTAVWPRGQRSQTRAVNDGSLVLAVAEGDRRLLLTGDLEPAGMAALMEAEPDLRAEAMLWPHHGHTPEAVGRLAAGIGAKVLVASASAAYASQTRSVLRAPGPVVSYCTGEVGAVTLELRPEGLYVKTFVSPPGAIAAAEDDGEKECDHDRTDD
jgi:competence protein ComEC